MHVKLHALLPFLLLGCFAKAQSNLFIDTTISAEQMVMDFFDSPCVTPSNVTFNGAPASIGYFQAAGTGLGLNAGIVISSGNVNTLAQPASEFSSSTTGTPSSDTDLGGLVSSPLFDAAILEFDLLVSDDANLDFQYVFGSEEYPDFVGSQFNDVFAFFVNSAGTMANIALIPGVNLPVTINNVNDAANSQYYVDNTASEHVALDGVTTVLPATFSAMGNQTYHVKIAVSDVADGVFDSGVFIGIQSLCGDSLLSPPAEAQLTVQGNVVAFQNTSRYATAWHWDFGDNTTSDERQPAPHEYAANGTYEVKLVTQNWCCSDTAVFQVVVSGVSALGETSAKTYQLSPNPATGYLTLQGDGSQTFDFQLFDMKGVALKMGSLRNDSSRLDLSGIGSGAYVLVLNDGTQVFRERLLIEKW